MYALIMAGGRGERLRPITLDKPKPMVPICGKPILQYQVESLRDQGVTDVVLLVGYKSEVIQAHFGSGDRWGVRVHYSVEDTPLGRGGALLRGLALVPSDQTTVIAGNGDIITSQRIEPMIEYHRRRCAKATIMLVPLKSPYGVVKQDRSGRIHEFAEKPILPGWINAGLYVLATDLGSLLPELGDHETTTFPELAARGQLFGYRSKSYWRAVDSIKDVNEAEAEVRDWFELMQPRGADAA